MIDSMYREEILEHYKSPLNFGKLSLCDVSSKQLNPFCGDEIEIFLKFRTASPGLNSANLQTPLLHSTGVLKDFKYRNLNVSIGNVRFIGRGCVISIASASLLTEYIKGKSKKSLQKFTEKDMITLLNIEISETRKKCALLALYTLKDCLKMTNF